MAETLNVRRSLLQCRPKKSNLAEAKINAADESPTLLMVVKLIWDLENSHFSLADTSIEAEYASHHILLG